MAHTVIMQATVPGTKATITIEQHPGNNMPFVVIGHAPFTLGGNWSCGRKTEAEARATANDHWTHIVGLRNKAQAQADAALADQQVPGLPGVTYGAVAAAFSDTGAEPTYNRTVSTHTSKYAVVKGLRSELASQLADLVPTHDKFRVAASLPGEDRVRFFVIDTPLRGKWAGAVFVKEQAGDDLYPVKPVGREETIIKAILADAKAALTLYGLELGSCGICGRTLTDEDSRRRGIGPVCAAKATGF
jgi:hypothetical protein